MAQDRCESSVFRLSHILQGKHTGMNGQVTRDQCMFCSSFLISSQVSANMAQRRPMAGTETYPEISLGSS